MPSPIYSCSCSCSELKTCRLQMVYFLEMCGIINNCHYDGCPSFASYFLCIHPAPRQTLTNRIMKVIYIVSKPLFSQRCIFAAWCEAIGFRHGCLVVFCCECDVQVHISQTIYTLIMRNNSVNINSVQTLRDIYGNKANKNQILPPGMLHHFCPSP